MSAVQLTDDSKDSQSRVDLAPLHPRKLIIKLEG